jgi:hypothetical protein
MGMVILLAATYVFTPVVVPGENVVQIFGINDREQTMVTTDLSSGTFHRGTYTRLPPPPSGYQVTGIGINNAGVITGPATIGSGTEQGFILRGTTYAFFSRPGWDNTEPRAIANSGLITGYNFSSDFTKFAGFIYNPDTNTFTDATPPGSTRTITQGMNAAGRICGDGRQPGLGRYAFVWQQGLLKKGKNELVPFLERVGVVGPGSAARGINDAGLITGFTVVGGETVGFVGNSARGYQLLIPPGAAAGTGNVCEGINNDAQVVCSFADVAGNTHAFIGSPRDDEDDDRQ